jgi:hypothetical protein
MGSKPAWRLLAGGVWFSELKVPGNGIFTFTVPLGLEAVHVNFSRICL